jgi:hypothetical protein
MQFGGMEGGRALRSLERFGAEVVPIIERELGSIVTAEAENRVLQPAGCKG